MKRLTLALYLFCLTLLTPLLSQPLQGAWRLTYDDVQPASEREMVAIFSDDYFMFGNYYKDGRFIGAGGGSYELNGDAIQLTFDFYTDDNSIVRVPQNYSLDLSSDEFTLKGNISGTQFTQKWEQLDAEPAPLDGDWRFAARVDEDGNVGNRRTPGPRQTVKLLGGGRFQWAAFNYETKEFMGTGGGTYEAEDGTYTENIEFFSRDDSRVGASLSFQFERKGDDWYHKGKSSKGDPLHEVWTVEE
ncbi:hypothetical protein OKW21_001377 [Catalinimonas alkaloidigena]|uniref:hypothetical protein n=1 Tax=Catalinimonas alkaloidigena TaxID=1075417 RepID=UPI00240670BC|nr:hypothetical protein [Catalinimonas alkaloidigena]MDF9796114.1 hypothetical protein [Catalinimonas alkaloidigena]